MKMTYAYPVMPIVAVCLGLSGFAAPVSAGPIYFASTPNGGSQSSTNGSSATSSYHLGQIPLPGGPTGSRDEFASAGPTGLRGSAQAHISGTFVGLQPHVVLAAGATARGSWDDFLVPGPAGDWIPATLNLRLTGTYGTDAVLGNNWADIGSATIDLGVGGSVAGQGFAGGFRQTRDGYPPPGSMRTSSSGVFGTAGSLPVNFTSPTFLVPVGVPFDVSLQLDASAFVEYWVSATSGPGPFTLDLLALSDFGHTLTFAADGPVFNLPDGHTVNSIGAQIVSNRWVGSAQAAVPEPTGLALVLVGLATLAGGAALRRWPWRGAGAAVPPGG